MTSLLGLGLLGGGLAFFGLVPKALEIALILLKAALEGLLAYLRTLWKAISESTYATWTLVGTAFVLGLYWSTSTCALEAPREAVHGQTSWSPIVTNQGRGAVLAPSKAREAYMSAKDIFCHWFGCL
jgi:hypothetical protein